MNSGVCWRGPIATCACESCEIRIGQQLLQGPNQGHKPGTTSRVQHAKLRQQKCTNTYTQD